jgi:hypothetical protein
MQKKYLLVIVVLAVACSLNCSVNLPECDCNWIEYNTTDETPVEIIDSIIVADFPEFENATTDLERINIMREWVYKTADRVVYAYYEEDSKSEHPIFLQNSRASQIYKYNSLELFDCFNQDEGGGWCALTAFFLTRLYQDHGYEAYCLSYGILDTISTHMVSMVSIEVDNKRIFTIQDPYFNISYINLTGEPLDYFDMLRLLGDRQPEKIQIQHQDNGYYDVLMPMASYLEYSVKEDWDWQVDWKSCCELDIALAKCPCTTSLEHYLSKRPQLLNIIQDAGYPPDTLYYFLFPYSINDGNTENIDLLNRALDIVESQEYIAE